MSRRPHVLNLDNSDGISLLEIILAITIVVVSLSALVSIANTASRNVTSSRGHSIADQYVRAGTEGLRHLRDNKGWATLLGDGTVSELDPGETQYYSFNSTGTLTYQTSSMAADVCGVSAVKSATYQIDPGYYRVVEMSLNPAGGEVTIKVFVCYGYRGSTHRQSDATTILTNWR